MDVLRVTVIGQDLFKIIKDVFLIVGLNAVNQVNTGMLGNLKTLTYEFELPKSQIIETRAKLMNEIAKDNMRMMALYIHGDWMRIFVMKPLRV